MPHCFIFNNFNNSIAKINQTKYKETIIILDNIIEAKI